MPHVSVWRWLVLTLSLLAPSFGFINTNVLAVQQAAQPLDELASKLSEAKTEAERTALLDASKELGTPELVAKLRTQGNLFIGQRQWLQATNTFLAMKEVATRLGDKAGIGGSLRGVGAVFYSQNKVGQALEFNKQSLDICPESCSKDNAVAAMVNLAQAHTRIGDYNEALAYLKRAEPLIGNPNNRPLTAAFFNISGEVNKYIGEFSAALVNYQQALALFQAENNDRAIAGMQLNIGTVYETVGEYPQAQVYFQKALAAGEAKNNKPIISQALNNLGNVYYHRGDYSKALECYERSLQLKEELKDSFGAANTLGNIANLYQQQGNIAQALAYNQKALEIRQALGNQRGVVNSYLNLGTVARRQKEYDKALEYYSKALQLSESMGSVDLQAHALAYLGILYNYKKDTTAALDTLSRAATLFKSFNSKIGLMEVLYSQALTYLSQKNAEEALRIADQAYGLAKEAGNRFVLWNGRELAGRALLNLGKPEQAQQQFAEAIQIVETMRAQAAGDESERAGFSEELVSPYFGMVKALMAQNKNGEAFYYSERAKGRVLLDVLQHGRVDVKKAMTDAERGKEEKLRIEMGSLNTQISQAVQSPKPEPGKLNELKSRLQNTRLEYDAFRNALYAAHPELKVKRGDAQIIRAEETAGLLPDANTALLSYFVIGEAAYLFVITRASTQAGVELKSYTLPISLDALAEQVTAFRNQLGARDPEFRQPARRLFDLLLKPAQAQLQGKTNLVISPDASLWELPFQTLVTGANRYLIEDAAIAYAPSLTVLRDMMKQRNPLPGTSPKPTLLAIGNPAISKEISDRTKASRRDEKLEPLPEAEREVKLLAEIYGTAQSRVYTGAEAREDRVKAEASEYKVLHFATHGILNDSTPMYSYLVLAQGGKNEDGLLEAWELMETDLHADLVVLSACETARGRVGAGEGVIGLSWALFVAGSPTAVVSQWKVDSAGTSELMLAFHKSLTGGRPNQKTHPSTAGALRAAALSLLKSTEYRHPFYWAGFSVIGDGR
jgi:CHAT domain-containing protein/ATP/maltotriose-dependent transcriptional regulator MalT